MTSANFSFIRVELPVQDEDGMIVSTGNKAVFAALTDDTQLRQMLSFAHTLAEALDGLASEIAKSVDLDPMSDQVSDAVYTCSDVDEALTILCPHMSQERRQ